MRIKIFLIIIPLFLVVVKTSSAQVKTNMEIISRLIDSSALKINQVNPNIKNGFYLKNTLSQNYNILNNQITSSFIKIVKEVHSKPDNSYPELDYSVFSITIKYSELFKDGFLGGYKFVREVVLDGNYGITNTENVVQTADFKFANIDTVDYDYLDQIESQGLSFTQAERPEEPMFASLLEPAIAVCTAAVVIYLFFTVRSK